MYKERAKNEVCMEQMEIALENEHNINQLIIWFKKKPTILQVYILNSLSQQFLCCNEQTTSS